jgi:dTDP-4-dehydrorhamnose reductase
MKILLTGRNGQVGYELERSLQVVGSVIAVDRASMDLVNLDQIRSVIREVQPDIIVNPAAYTAVDKAETEPDLAMLINGIAPGVMAEEARKLGAAMIHYSTDYVFDGSKESPYEENDEPCPLNEYGRTKLAGEHAVQSAGIKHLILRTSWVYGMHGKNFLQTMLKLAQERDELKVVSDQFGTPTWSRTIADVTANLIAQARHAPDPVAWWRRNSGVYHLTSNGSTNWHAFAQALLSNAGLLQKTRVLPIPSAQYPTPARRPINSRLSCEKLRTSFSSLPDWQTALKLCQQT